MILRIKNTGSSQEFKQVVDELRHVLFCLPGLIEVVLGAHGAGCSAVAELFGALAFLDGAGLRQLVFRPCAS